MTKPSIDAMQTALELVKPEGTYVRVSEDLENGNTHIIVHTSVYAQCVIEPDILIAANHPAAVVANHFEMNVAELREQLMKIVEAIDARTH